MKIRQATKEDTSACLHIYAPFVTDSPASFEREVPSLEEFSKRIEKCNQTHAWIVAEDDTGILGYAYGSTHRGRYAYQWSAEVSVYLAESARGKGLGPKLYADLFDRLKQRGYVRAFAGITLPNDASVRFHQSFGFESIGVFSAIGYKFGKWHDVGWWQKDIVPLPKEPNPIKA